MDSKNTVQTIQLLLLVNGKQLADLCEKSVSLVLGDPPETDGFVCLWEKLLTSKRKTSHIFSVVKPRRDNNGLWFFVKLKLL